MYDQQAPEMLPMLDPKDKALMDMSYRAGRGELFEERFKNLKHSYEELRRDFDRLQAGLERERELKDRIQETYDKLNAHVLKMEKKRDKLKKESK